MPSQEIFCLFENSWGCWVKLALLGILIVLVLSTLAACKSDRKGGELRLKHEVTVQSPDGERRHHSVVRLEAYQGYSYGAGTSGWGGITALATGHALRVPTADNDFFFPLVEPAPAPSTPGWSQMALVKKYFGLPNATSDDSWTSIWKSLAQGNSFVELDQSDIPAIVVMPRGGWMNDARKISIAEAEQLGLRIVRYRLAITKEPVGASAPFEPRYRPTEARYQPIGTLGRNFFSADRER